VRSVLCGIALLVFCAGPGYAKDARTCQVDRDCAPWEQCDASHLCSSREPDPSEGQLRNGRILASFGAFFAVLGAVLVGVGETPPVCFCSADDNRQTGVGLVISGSILLGAGVILVAAGAPLWVKGARGVKSSPPKSAGLSLGPSSLKLSF
jgi:hypothetical protein